MALEAFWHKSPSTIWSQLTFRSHPHTSASAEVTYFQHLCFPVLSNLYAVACVLLLLQMLSPPLRVRLGHLISCGKSLWILCPPMGTKPLLPRKSYSNLSATQLLGTITSSACEHDNYRCIFLLSLRAWKCVWYTVTAPKIKKCVRVVILYKVWSVT